MGNRHPKQQTHATDAKCPLHITQHGQVPFSLPLVLRNHLPNVQTCDRLQSKGKDPHGALRGLPLTRCQFSHKVKKSWAGFQTPQ